ncbi:DNA-directed RNA polymerase subunit alpha [Candidatus Shapirobacteria bacterium]|nr:DNA-directed RNA polymerase subunit alpha [Candidatus Shapirobacteria bacterium]
MENFKFWISKKEEESKGYGRFILSPLPQGFGDTFGNSLRRVLLQHMPGVAITRIRVKGANHSFALIKGVKEDLIDVIMNIKKIRIKSKREGLVKFQLAKKGPGVVKAGDIKIPTGVEITNPDLVLANLADRQSELKIDFEAEKGVGYSLADEHKSEKMRWISVDAIFSPIVKVNYSVKDIRIGKKEGMNELALEIWTNQTISSAEALKKAAEILEKGFSLIVKPAKKPAAPAKKEVVNDSLSLYLEEIDLPLRLVNALKKSGFKKLADFEDLKKSDLLKVKNVGDKSCDQLIKVLRSRGVNIKS